MYMLDVSLFNETYFYYFYSFYTNIYNNVYLFVYNTLSTFDSFNTEYYNVVMWKLSFYQTQLMFWFMRNYLFIFLFFGMSLCLSYSLQNMSLRNLLYKLPFLGGKIKRKLYESTEELESSLNNGPYMFLQKLPEHSFSEDKLFQVINSMREKREHDSEQTDTTENNGENYVEYSDGLANRKISGVVYHGCPDHIQKLVNVFNEFAVSNPLHPDLFPFIRNMEIDIVNMVSSMFKGGPQCCGNVTYGGTESILLACVTYRDYFKKTRGIHKPNIVAFDSVHPAFDKACHYFGIEMKKIIIDNYEDWYSCSERNVISKIASYVDSNTILLVGSAPSYPHGIIDSVVQMGKVASERNIGFHIDACLGGFLIPFLQEFSYINFELEGVTSISVDTHKYGYSLKGSSVLLFKDEKIKLHQHYINLEWSGGVYATPTLMGSKSGGLIASTWASLLYIGREKYVELATQIRNNLNFIYSKVKKHSVLKEHISIIGEPRLNVIAFKAVDEKKCNIYKVAHEMKKLGWNLSVMHKPQAFHFCLTRLHTREICEQFCRDLITSVSNVLECEECELSGTLALYGASSSLEGGMFIDEIVHNFIYLLSKEQIKARHL